MTYCRSCDKAIEAGHTVVGLPVIRIQAEGKSQLAGTEVLFHLHCFLKHFGKEKVKIITGQPQ